MLQTGRKALVYALFIAVAGQSAPNIAAAKSIEGRSSHSIHPGRSGFSTASHVIQCVAFAKQDAGIELTGNARDWWINAEGVYARGHHPEIGSVLSFRAVDRMPLGHVAVVASVEDSRTITIDQSHWNSRGITRAMVVKDVSEDNDWSAVRVQLAHEDAFGSIYPTHGFIYARADTGVIEQAAERAPMPMLDAAPADLRLSRRSRAVRAGRVRAEPVQVEVAEMPAPSRGLDLSLNGIASDAPDRDFR
jgi:surface antigen